MESVDPQPNSAPEDPADVHAPAGSATVRKGEPSATELAMLQVNLTSDEDDRLDKVLEDALVRYAELATRGQAALNRHITAVTSVMRKNGWDTPVSEDHRSPEDSPDGDDVQPSLSR
jgi:hypothetical protein